MGRAAQGGAARIMAAVVCTVAALTGMTTPASAADGTFPGIVGGAPVAATPEEAIAAAAALAETTIDAATAALPADVTEAVPADGQYQPSNGQYHGENGQYQEPSTTEPTPVTAPPAPDVAAAAAVPANINVSVRVLSPGDDGPINQSNTGIQPVSTQPTGGVAVAASTPHVTISVSVNVTNNWITISNSAPAGGWYQAPDTQYQTPADIGAGTASATTQLVAPAPPSTAAAPAPAAAAAPPAAAAPARRAWAPRDRLSRSRRGTPGTGRGRAAMTRPVAVAAVATVAATAPAPVVTAPPRAATVRARSGSAPQRMRPQQAPAFPPKPVPEQLGSGAASGGFGFGNLLQSLAILVASLCLAWLAAAGRLVASMQPPGDPPLRRRRKPG